MKERKENTVRDLALLGARVRLAELEQRLQETKDVIKALQGKPNTTRTRTRRSYSDKFKAKVIADARSSSVRESAEKHRVRTNQVYKWLRK